MSVTLYEEEVLKFTKPGRKRKQDIFILDICGTKQF